MDKKINTGFEYVVSLDTAQFTLLIHHVNIYFRRLYFKGRSNFANEGT